MCGLRIMKRGEELGQSKFKESQILEIYKMYDLGFSNNDIAEKFNTSYQNIKFITKGVTWKHIYNKYYKIS